PDGRTILTGCWDKAARLWDASTGRPIGPPLEHPDRVGAMFSPDGRTILTGCSDGTAHRWDAATGRRLGRPPGQPGEGGGVAYSPDGRSILVGGGDGTARLWDSGVGQPIHRPLDYGRPRYMGYQSLVFGPDGETMLIADCGQVQLREVASGRLLGR